MVIRTKKSSVMQSPTKERTPTHNNEKNKLINHLKINNKNDAKPMDDEDGMNTNSCNSKGKNPYYFTFFNEKNDQPSNNGAESVPEQQQ